MCFTTRSIHIEKWNSLETDAFINALFRFVSQRGCPKTVPCDNATNFVSGHNELSKSLRQSVADYFGLMLGRRQSCWADVGPLAAMFSWLLGTFHDGSLWWFCILLSVGLCTVYSYSLFCFICKNTKRHTAHTIVSWPNPKQWVIVHTPDLMMIISKVYIFFQSLQGNG